MKEHQDRTDQRHDQRETLNKKKKKLHGLLVKTKILSKNLKNVRKVNS